MAQIRFGVLGAARIVPSALIAPARSVPEATVSAVAARDAARATAFAAANGIPRVLPSYQALIDDPEIDAIYNPLPNNLHAEWTIRALEAGKHVLCEKPIASNTREAEQMADAARRTGKVLVEAFHWRYHPLALRMLDVIRSGRIGTVRHADVFICFPLLSPGDIRYRLDLSGGATMDAGCYAISMLRHLVGEEPTVTAAKAKLSSPDVDRFMAADFTFGSGATGRMTCSMFSAMILRISARVQGDLGEVTAYNPVIPSMWNRLVVRTPAGRTAERVTGDTSYTYQLRAFAPRVLTGADVPTGPDDAVANMRVIDSVYTRAGLPLRGVTARALTPA